MRLICGRVFKCLLWWDFVMWTSPVMLYLYGNCLQTKQRIKNAKDVGRRVLVKVVWLQPLWLSSPPSWMASHDAPRQTAYHMWGTYIYIERSTNMNMQMYVNFILLRTTRTHRPLWKTNKYQSSKVHALIVFWQIRGASSVILQKSPNWIIIPLNGITKNNGG